jgi:hypothetical protein
MMEHVTLSTIEQVEPDGADRFWHGIKKPSINWKA